MKTTKTALTEFLFKKREDIDGLLFKSQKSLVAELKKIDISIEAPFFSMVCNNKRYMPQYLMDGICLLIEKKPGLNEFIKQSLQKEFLDIVKSGNYTKSSTEVDYLTSEELNKLSEIAKVMNDKLPLKLIPTLATNLRNPPEKS